MPRPSRGFQGLLTAAPAPLPDDEPQPPTEPSVADERPEPAAAAAEPASAPVAAVTAVTAPAGKPEGRAASRSKPARSRTHPETPASPPAAGPAGEERAATTIRLRQPAAAALNSAWLHQRMHVNPKLSYPEFASEIVRLGLAAFERQAKRS